MAADFNDDDNVLDIKKLIGILTATPMLPDHTFLIGGATRGEIYTLAGNIKSALLREGVGDFPLCVCTLNRAHMAAALLASLSDGPPLILPFAHSLDTLSETYQKIPYKAALVDDECRLPDGVRSFLTKDVDTEPLWLDAAPSLRPDKPWLYLFTGGSTGSPKIWSKTPLNLLAEAFFLSRTFGITGEDRILSTVPVNHIYGLLYSVLLPLVTGAAVCHETPSFPKEIDHALAVAEATVFVGIPAHYRALKESPVRPHQLRMAFSSAGVLAEEDDWAFASATGIPVTEVYGSTETGGIAYRQRAAGKPVLTPFSCVDILIENEHLHVRSDFLSVELPKDRDGYYRTADRAVFDGQSGLALLGRSDGVVKVGGKRVDLAKIQQFLKGEAGVRDAYVFTVPVESGRENEIRVIIEGDVVEEDIRRAAISGLEAYEQPRRIRIVGKIPVSMSGKYNRVEIEALFDKPVL